MTMLEVTAVCVWLTIVGMVEGGTAVGQGTQTANGNCLRLVGENQIRLDVSIFRNTDPMGIIVAKDIFGNDDSTCAFTDTGTHWTLRSYVNTVTNTAASSSNGCKFSTAIDANMDLTYTWRVHYFENFHFDGNRDKDYGKDRRYIITCNMANIVDNMVTANITSVSAPDLNKVIAPITTKPTLHIWAKNDNGIFEQLGNQAQIDAGTVIKLQVRYTYDTTKIPTIPVAIGATWTQVDNVFPLSNNAYDILDGNGCPVTTAPSFPPSVGFVRTTTGNNNGGRFEAETDAFNAWRIGNIDQLYFVVKYDFCSGSLGLDGDNFCIDPCTYSTNIAARRRRRQVEDDRSIYVSIRIVDNSQETTDQQVEGVNTALVIGASVGGVVLLLCVVLLACVAVVMCRRRSQDKRSEQKIQPAHFENKLHY